MNYQNPRLHDTVISSEEFREIEERETDKQNAPKFLQRANTERAEFINKQVRKEGRNPLNQGDMEEWLNEPSEPFSPAAQMVIAHCGEIMGDHPVVKSKMLRRYSHEKKGRTIYVFSEFNEYLLTHYPQIFDLHAHPEIAIQNRITETKTLALLAKHLGSKKQDTGSVLRSRFVMGLAHLLVTHDMEVPSHITERFTNEQKTELASMKQALRIRSSLRPQSQKKVDSPLQTLNETRRMLIEKGHLPEATLLISNQEQIAALVSLVMHDRMWDQRDEEKAELAAKRSLIEQFLYEVPSPHTFANRVFHLKKGKLPL